MENTAKSVREIGILSVCHAGVDFLCALAVYGRFMDTVPYVFFIYNFCAFALQMPLGVVLDAWTEKSGHDAYPGLVFTLAGIGLTILGTFAGPVILGLGNALFHVGGGVLTIQQDRLSGFAGRGLGVFVAPGAVGLCLGMLWGKQPYAGLLKAGMAAVLFLLSALLCRKREQVSYTPETRKENHLGEVMLGAFLVVILRSYVGIAAGFAWKLGFAAILLSAVCAALGKAAGGFLSVSLGQKRMVILTLGISCLAALFSRFMGAGLLFLLMFNMTMPLTLYLAAEAIPARPGLAFGILTFALFLGYVPLLYGYRLPVSTEALCFLGALLSMGILVKVSR